MAEKKFPSIDLDDDGLTYGSRDSIMQCRNLDLGNIAIMHTQYCLSVARCSLAFKKAHRIEGFIFYEIISSVLLSRF